MGFNRKTDEEKAILLEKWAAEFPVGTKVAFDYVTIHHTYRAIGPVVENHPFSAIVDCRLEGIGRMVVPYGGLTKV